jgi:hypothetical protein
MGQESRAEEVINGMRWVRGGWVWGGDEAGGGVNLASWIWGADSKMGWVWDARLDAYCETHEIG